jgi:ketosteroid isomerase-like protein
MTDSIRLDYESNLRIFEVRRFDGSPNHMRAQGKTDEYWTHHNGTQIVEIEGDIAKCETYALALCRIGAAGEPGYDREMFLRVRYLDRVKKWDGVWKTAHRRAVYPPCHIVKIEEEFILSLSSDCLHDAGFPKGEVYKWQQPLK